MKVIITRNQIGNLLALVAHTVKNSVNLYKSIFNFYLSKFVEFFYNVDSDLNFET